MGRLIDEDDVFAESDKHEECMAKSCEIRGVDDNVSSMYLLAHRHIKDAIKANVPTAHKLQKILDLTDGTIDHFDRDDAMDLLYQIKEVLK